MRSDRGQALLEFAIAVPLVLMVSVASFEVARAVWQLNALGYAAGEGARYVIAHGAASEDPVGPATATDGPVRDAVVRAAVGLPAPSVVATWPDGNNTDGSRVTVEATIVFIPVASQYLTGGALRVTLRGVTTQVIR